MPYKDKAKQKEWVAKNKEKIAAWRLANREHLAEKTREWRKKNPEKARATERANYLKNIEKKRAYALEWKRNNPEKVRASQRKFRQNHLEEEKERHKQIRISLSDGYIKDKLGFSKSDDVPQELIEVKRLQLQIRRMTNEISNNTTK